MRDLDKLDRKFDDLLYQIYKGNTHEKLEKGVRYIELEKIKEWKSKFGFSFNIYSNEHFIDNQPHFHFDNKEKGIKCKIGFNGKIFECKGSKRISNKILKELKYFLIEPNTIQLLKKIWNLKNPELKG